MLAPPVSCQAPEPNSSVQQPIREASPFPSSRPNCSSRCAKTPFSLLLKETSCKLLHWCYIADFRAKDHELATTHAALHKRGYPCSPVSPDQEDCNIGIQHYAPGKNAHLNMLNWSHNGLDYFPFLPKACDQISTKLLRRSSTRKNIFMVIVVCSAYNPLENGKKFLQALNI